MANMYQMKQHLLQVRVHKPIMLSIPDVQCDLLDCFIRCCSNSYVDNVHLAIQGNPCACPCRALQDIAHATRHVCSCVLSAVSHPWLLYDHVSCPSSCLSYSCTKRDQPCCFA